MTEIFERCKCGSTQTDTGTDKMTEATIIECFYCGRMVGGISKIDAVEMWNETMTGGVR